MKKLLITSAIFFIISNYCSAQFTVDSIEKIFLIDFSDFNGTGFAPAPQQGQLDSDTWSIKGLSDGDLNYGDTKTINSTDFTRGIHTGGTATGGVYAFNTGNNIVLGVQPIGTDFTPGTFVLKIINQTTDTIKSLYVSYDIFYLNDQGRGNSLVFSYSTDSLFYISIPSFDFTSPDVASANPIWEKTNKNILLQGIAIAPASLFYFKWEGDDKSGTGSRDEYGIDNIKLIANPKPANPAFTSNNVCEGGFVQFINTSYTVADSIISYHWNFGDGTIDSVASPSHMFASHGSYNVSLVAQTMGGYIDSATNIVAVHPIPQVLFSINSVFGCGQLNAQLYDSSLIANGNIASRFWNFGDLSSDTGIFINHLYTHEGNYSVKLIVASENGCMDSASQNITIHSIPTANYTYSISGHTVNFNDSSFIASGNIISYNWYFGDGAGDTLSSTVHTYTNSGNYTATLVVNSTYGCSDTITRIISIINTGAIENTEIGFVNFFPNPVLDHELFIATNNFKEGANETSVRITNTLGEIVLQQSVIISNYGVNRIDVSSIIPGTYIVSLLSNDAVFSEKIIIY